MVCVCCCQFRCLFPQCRFYQDFRFYVRVLFSVRLSTLLADSPRLSLASSTHFMSLPMASLVVIVSFVLFNGSHKRLSLNVTRNHLVPSLAFTVLDFRLNTFLIGPRWCASAEDFRSFWSTPVHSNLVLVLACLFAPSLSSH